MRFHKIIAINILLVFVTGTAFSGVAFATDFSGASFIIRDPVLTPAGGASTSSNFQQTSSIGQPVSGETSSTNFILRSGFGYFPTTPTLTQTTHRWYAPIDLIQPVTSLAAENTAITGLSVNSNLRLRMAIRSSGEIFPSNKFFKLQFASLGSASSCSGVASSAYAGVGSVGSVQVWAGYDNPSVVSGAQISANLLSTAASGSRETYEETPVTSITAATPLTIATGSNADAEWDWSLRLQGAQDGNMYCFRMVQSDGTLLSAYTNYPQAGLSGSGSSSGSSGGGSSGGGGVYRDGTLGAPAATVTPTTTTATPGKTEVLFSGKAYPGAKLTLLKDGAAAGSFTASETGDFVISLSNVDAGRYSFVLYGDDSKGLRSSSFTKNVDVAKDKSTKVDGVVIAPTIRVNKSKVKQGETVSASGQTYPQAKVKLVVSGKTKLSIQKQADKNGQYFYNFDSGVMEKGDYTIQASVDTSEKSQSVNFNVGGNTVLYIDPAALKYDLDSDGQVNLVDFSIMAFWYNKPAPTDSAQLIIFKSLDLNSDGKIDLQDFSILTFWWTG